MREFLKLSWGIVLIVYATLFVIVPVLFLMVYFSFQAYGLELPGPMQDWPAGRIWWFLAMPLLDLFLLEKLVARVQKGDK